MSEKNREIVSRLINGINERDIEILDKLLSSDFINHSPFPGCANDGAGYKSALTMAREAFPDMNIHCHDMIADRNKVALRLMINGTHKGELLGIHPTGKKVSWSAIVILNMVDGKISERWEEQNIMGLMEQLRG